MTHNTPSVPIKTALAAMAGGTIVLAIQIGTHMAKVVRLNGERD